MASRWSRTSGLLLRPPGSGHLDIAGFVGIGSCRRCSIDLVWSHLLTARDLRSQNQHIKYKIGGRDAHRSCIARAIAICSGGHPSPEPNALTCDAPVGPHRTEPRERPPGPRRAGRRGRASLRVADWLRPGACELTEPGRGLLLDHPKEGAHPDRFCEPGGRGAAIAPS
jgi:hypothetical protein